jgi:hypothetical protein
MQSKDGKNLDTLAIYTEHKMIVEVRQSFNEES